MTATLTLPLTLTVTLTVTLLGLGCRGGAVSTAPSSAAVEPIFRDVALASGIDFVHANGATGSFFYPELMQGGAAFLDYDNDRDLDIYLVQSGPLPAPGDSPQAANRLYRNRGDGSFEDATASAGVGDRGYGSGVAVADYDGDGWVDLYVTNLGANHLYRNRGDGSFEDATGRTATGDASYSTSAAFFDYDHDGDLDLYVCNYVDWSTAKERRCLGRNGLQGYCSPSEYRPQADTLYRNDGDGRFTDVSARAGIASVRAAGLGVVTADFDGDGWTDVYVANDQMANLLWMNRGDGTFVDEALLRGAALNGMGRPEAGMGVIVEDGDSDGDWDLFMVHLSGETNTYYENRGGDFRDVTDALGLGAVSQPYPVSESASTTSTTTVGATCSSPTARSARATPWSSSTPSPTSSCSVSKAARFVTLASAVATPSRCWKSAAPPPSATTTTTVTSTSWSPTTAVRRACSRTRPGIAATGWESSW